LEIEISQTAVGSVLVVDPAPLDTIARSRLEAEVVEGWTVDPDSVELTLATPTASGDVATYPFTIAGTQVRDVDQAALLESIRG
ncbi:hypothetical protein, partial [Mycobacterium tuberculosis]|uniref:hypothetical protein n=1 Tax=Mycobacterium tuberculosis TaxID=1773 RepID=UPI0025505FA4